MYEDAWYNAFVPAAPARPEFSHKRRVSMLQQPQEGLPADVQVPELSSQVVDPPNERDELPIASLRRRAQSYSDFHDASQAHLKSGILRDRSQVKRKSRQRRRSQVVSDETEGASEDGEDLSDELLDASHAKYQLYLDQLSSSRGHLDSLLDDTTSNIDLLSTLAASFKAVETQTATFQERCESLLAEQRRIATLADDIGQNLQYYNYLDPITRRLNAPGAGHLARGDEFSTMLSQLDHCLDYMQTHPDQKEATAYGSRYKLLLTRGLTLIRVNFTNTLREISSDVSKRIADRQLNDTTMPALLYAKFRVGAPELKKLALEIQKRAAPPMDAEPGAQGEYQSLVNELHQSYSAARGRLIVPLVRRKMAEISALPNTSKDLIAFARSSISYFRGLCLDEYDLWHEWFEGDDGLYDFLETMCEPLFDYLRPRTIHETQLPKLCEVCNLIQVRYMEDQDDDSDPDEPHRLDFSRLIQQALYDAQTRLVFLAQGVVRDDIEKYKPKAEDIDYPAKVKAIPLSGTKSKAPPLSGKKNATSSPKTPVPKAPTIVDEDGVDAFDLQWRYNSDVTYQSWFPTLKKAIWLLSRIYRLVNSSVFDDLAHDIVHQTTLSLHRASQQIASKTSTIDAQLFLLKQLLTLKQQIVTFDIEFVTHQVDVDFSSITNTFYELRSRGGLFNPRNLVRLVGSGLMPGVVENMLDAKAELDARLRTVINDFTSDAAAKMTPAVASEVDTSKADFAGGKSVRATRVTIEKEIPVLRNKLDQYLDDTRTKETLVGAVQDQALATYEDFFERYTSRAKANGTASVSKKGKGREDDVWDPDTFADWMVEVFGVSRVGIGEDEDGVSTRGTSLSPVMSRSGKSLMSGSV
ncbi:MAG: Golgi transport complex subunit 3 [Chrysothrix sp. TS-e1954]|nr:MAG: Golgi transport complex subunit 3 [Chrysothrix sp. TS-e1954]